MTLWKYSKLLTPRGLTGRLALAGLTALAVLAALGLSPRAAQAAYNQNNARSNHARAGLTDDGGASVDEFSTKLAAMETLLASVQEQMAQIAALQGELASLGAGVDSSRSASAAADQDYMASVEEAARIFSEQVAGVLDADVAAQVTASLAQLQAQLTTRTTSDDPEQRLSDALSEVSASVTNVQGALQELQGNSKKIQEWVKAAYDGKE